MSNFHPVEVVARGSETQLQVAENLHLQPYKCGDGLYMSESDVCYNGRRPITEVFK